MRQTTQAQIAYDFIKKQIVNRFIYPGNRVIEEEIVQQSGVSRTSVRSALMRLAYEGLIIQKPNRGAFVAKPSATDLRQVYETRQILEVGAFKLAIKNRSKADVRHLKENLEKQNELKDLFNMIDYVRLNREFHSIIVDSTNNAYLEKFLDELHNKVATYLLFWDTSTTNRLSLEIHEEIFEAYRDQNEELGVKAVLKDIYLAEDSLKNTQML